MLGPQCVDIATRKTTTDSENQMTNTAETWVETTKTLAHDKEGDAWTKTEDWFRHRSFALSSWKPDRDQSAADFKQAVANAKLALGGDYPGKVKITMRYPDGYPDASLFVRLQAFRGDVNVYRSS